MGLRRRRLHGLTLVLAVVAFAAMAAVRPSVVARAAGTGGAYNPLPPSRILDTRDGTGGVPAQPLGQGQTLDVQVGGRGNVPTTATAAVLNVTVTGTTAASYLTVFPAGATRPVASNLNWVAGQTIPNLVEVGLSTSGQVTVYNAVGSVHVIFDVAGYVATNLPAGQGLYNPLVPARVLDTRDGTGGVPMGPVGSGATVNLQVLGAGGVPTNGVSGVVLNVTVTGPTAASYLTVYPSDQSRPIVSNLNFVGQETIPNRVIVKVSPIGTVSFYNALGSVHVIADVGGWFTDGTNPAAIGSTFTPLTPNRILDTRGSGFLVGVGNNGQFPPLSVQVAGQGGVPAMTDPSQPSAVVANVTVTDTTAGSYLTAWPDGATRPVASDLNWIAGTTIPNLVIVKLSSGGAIDVYNAAGCASVIIDVVGYYTGPPVTASSSVTGAANCPKPGDNCGAPSNPWGYNFCDYYGGNTISNPPSNFCSYFSCIASFWSFTNGYVAECNDTKYSHSGGVSGACSSHGGEWRPLLHR